MQCNETREKQELFVLGGLPRPDRAGVAGHLARCAAGAAADRDLRRLIGQLRDALPVDEAARGIARH